MPKPPRGALCRHAASNRYRALAVARAAANLGTQVAGTSLPAPRLVLATDRAAANPGGQAARTASQALRLVLTTARTAANPGGQAARTDPRAPRVVLAIALAAAEPGGQAARTVFQTPRPAGTPAVPLVPTPRAPDRLVVASAQPPRAHAHRGQPRGGRFVRRGIGQAWRPGDLPPPTPGPWTPPRLSASCFLLTPKRTPLVPNTTRTWQSIARPELGAPNCGRDTSPRLPRRPISPTSTASTFRPALYTWRRTPQGYSSCQRLGTHSQALSSASSRLFVLETVPPPQAPPATPAVSVAHRLPAASDYPDQPSPALDLRSTLTGTRRSAPYPAGPPPDFPPARFGDGIAQPPPWAPAATARVVRHSAISSRPIDFLASSRRPGSRPTHPGRGREVRFFHERSDLLGLG